MEAIYDAAAVQRFLQNVARTSHFKFRAGMQASRGGRIYRLKGGRMHKASAPEAYPAIRSGATAGSIRTEVKADEATIGTNTYYAKWLRSGTKKMKKRKMSPDALKEGVQAARPSLGHFARFRHG
jgi:phage gpG-like protein